MKTKILSIFTIVTLLLVSCSKEYGDSFVFRGDNFISFDGVESTTLAISEDQGETNITFRITRPQPVDVTVNFEVEELEVNVGYIIPSTSIVIPAGSTSANFVIIPVDDEETTPSTRLVVTMVSSNPSFQIGIREPGSFRKEITIVNDDCPTGFNLWFGALSVEDVGFPPPLAAVGSGNASGACDILRVTAATNLVGWTSGAIANAPHDFLFIPFFEGGTQGFVELQPTLIGRANFNFPGEAGGAGEVFYEITFGQYDEDTKIIEVSYVVRVRQVSTGNMFNLTGWNGTNRIIKP